MPDETKDSVKLWESIDSAIKCEEVRLGRYSSDDYMSDPKHLVFVASRYKFVAKMFDGLDTAIEIGCGDGFGGPIVAKAVKKLICTDINPPMLADIGKRNAFAKNISYESYPFHQKAYEPQVDGIYLVDVIEHIYKEEEGAFMTNLAASLKPHGVALIGTPNKTTEQYQNEWSRKSHVNLKTHEDLKKLGLKHFHNVFMFGMNDEVLHTGFAPMCHYLWALCVDPRR